MLRNQTRLFLFKEKIFYWKFLNILGMKNVPCITKIVISFNIRDIKDIEDDVVVKFFYYLEVICNQKVFLNKFIKGNLKAKMKSINLTGQITLRGLKLYNFFDYFFYFIMPILKKNFIKLPAKVDSVGNLSINLKDLSLTPGLTEEFQIGYPVKIDIIFQSSNYLKSKYILKELGF